MTNFETSVTVKARIYAAKVHHAAGCTYGEDDEPYTIHTDTVNLWAHKYRKAFLNSDDARDTMAAAYTHDAIEDAQQTYNDVRNATSKEVADITFAVTDVHEINRMLRFLATAPKILKDHRAFVLKLCDIGANSSYGKGQKNGMYRKYQKEWWGYKRYIFVNTMRLHQDKLNLEVIDVIIERIDEILGQK